MWDSEGEIARAAQILIEPGGEASFRHVGVDTVDRPTTEELLAAAQALNAPALATGHHVHPHLDAGPSERAFQRDLGTYMRGVRSAAANLHERSGSSEAAQAERMADSMLKHLGD